MKEPGFWTMREIEGKLSECYCMINTDYRTHRSKFSYKIISLDPLKTEPVANPKYDPTIKKPRKPLYCKRMPSEHCYENQCPHFAYCECDPEEQEKIKNFKRRKKHGGNR
jgi:hypothetical protein